MGMYTEFHFNSEMKKDLPQDVVDILKYMTGIIEEQPTELPDHPLFKTDRWDYMLRTGSYYFDADPIVSLRWDEISNAYYLCSRSDFKNYFDEIEKFIDWITPYLNKYEGDFLGFSRYEEYEEPCLIFYKQDSIKKYSFLKYKFKTIHSAFISGDFKIKNILKCIEGRGEAFEKLKSELEEIVGDNEKALKEVKD